jgi:hypothetical protein
VQMFASLALLFGGDPVICGTHMHCCVLVRGIIQVTCRYQLRLSAHSVLGLVFRCDKCTSCQQQGSTVC